MYSFDRMEGRRHAVATLGSIQGMPAAFVQQSDVVANLRAAWGSKPGEYAQGVRDVLEAIDAMAAR